MDSYLVHEVTVVKVDEWTVLYTPENKKNLSYRSDSARCVKRIFNVTQVHPLFRCCSNRRGIYDFLLALNSNVSYLTSIFNRS